MGVKFASALMHNPQSTRANPCGSDAPRFVSTFNGYLNIDYSSVQKCVDANLIALRHLQQQVFSLSLRPMELSPKPFIDKRHTLLGLGLRPSTQPTIVD
jgi:hypothetical protein